MAHFAELDKDNKVIRVIVVHNNELKDAKGKESEAKGIEFCKSLFGQDTTWIQTSYNNNLRKRYAGIGYKYYENLDAFVSPKPFPSWILNFNLQWEAPVSCPNDNKSYVWNEPTLSWIEE